MAATLESVRSIHSAMAHAAAQYREQLSAITQQEDKLSLQKSLINLDQLNAITQQEDQLKLQKALIKATAADELTKVGAQLKLGSEILAKATMLMLAEPEMVTRNGEYHLHAEFRKLFE
jgi:hypothetical protein